MTHHLTRNMNRRYFLLIGSALLLSSCDAAAPALEAQVRQTFVAQCEQFAADSGIVPGLVEPVCACGVDEVIEGGAAGLAQISTARLQEVVTTCAQRIGSPGEAATTETEIG